MQSRSELMYAIGIVLFISGIIVAHTSAIYFPLGAVFSYDAILFWAGLSAIVAGIGVIIAGWYEGRRTEQLEASRTIEALTTH